MSKPKYLQQRKTGRVFPFSNALMKRGDMVPYEGEVKPAKASKKKAAAKKEPEPNQNPATSTEPNPGDPGEGEGGEGNEGEGDEITANEIVIDGETYALDAVSRDAIADYAERHFGEKLDRRRKQADLAEALRALIAENGHPDAD